MSFVRKLNKCYKKVPLNKTALYNEIMSERSTLEKNGFNIKIKDEFDLFNLEIIVKGIKTKKMIDEAYDTFLSNNYDILPYLNYEEKKRMFDVDIKDILEEAPHFTDTKSNSEIYIPFLESFVNEWYSKDYSIMTLKQHHDYVSNYKAHIRSVIELYGYEVYNTDFSCLKVVYEDERHICFYYDEFYTVYIFKKENMEYLNEVTFFDKKCKGVLEESNVIDIINFIEEYKYKECLDYLKDHQMITDKNYKKLSKEYKQEG